MYKFNNVILSVIILLIFSITLQASEMSDENLYYLKITERTINLLKTNSNDIEIEKLNSIKNYEASKEILNDKLLNELNYTKAETEKIMEYAEKVYTIENPVFKEALAYRWAPIHYQDILKKGSHSENGRADYITKINFDGDWLSANNSKSLSEEVNGHFKYPLTPAVYYSRLLENFFCL